MENQNKKSELEQIKDLFFFLLKHWYYFVIAFGIFGIIGIIHLKTATPVWNVLARVALRNDESLMGANISRTSSLMSSFGLGGGGAQNIEDETLKMSSQGYIRNVVEKLGLNTSYVQSQFLGFSKTNLYDQSPILLSVDPFLADTLTTTIKFQLKVSPEKTRIRMKAGKKPVGNFEISTFPATIETKWGKYTFEKSPAFDSFEFSAKLKIDHSSYDAVAQVYRNRLLIDYHKRTSDLINLGLKDENVPFAKTVLSEVIDSYNREWLGDKELVNEKTLEFINNRLVLTQVLLYDADIQIQEFKDKYNLTEIDADVTFYLRSTGELQAQLLKAETQLNIANIIVDFVQNENNKYALIPFDLTLADANMANAITQYNTELIRRNESRGSNESPMARSLDVQLEMQRQNLLVSLNNIKKGLQVSLETIKKREREFNAKIGKVPTIERDYVNLRRAQELQQTVYAFLLEMREQSAIKGINILPKLKIIDRPYVVNKKVSPSKLNTVFMVFIGGMALSLLLVYGIPYLKERRRKNQ
jgi:uncharacterized protein involved in exopolysaccharide biosynthesis